MILRYMILYQNNTRTKIKVWFADENGKFRRFAVFAYTWPIHRKLIDRLPLTDRSTIQWFSDALIVTNPIIYTRR